MRMKGNIQVMSDRTRTRICSVCLVVFLVFRQCYFRDVISVWSLPERAAQGVPMMPM